MHRIDRLFGYVLALQRGHVRTAAQLAAQFEVSRRTVYRDLEALDHVGVPIVSKPGRGYALAPGYHLPPVMFSAEEASSLALAGGLFRQFVARDDRAALDTALGKVEAVLPERTRSAVEETRRRVSLSSWPHHAAPLDSELPLLVRRAMRERRRLRICYHARTSGSSGDRTIDPHALVFYAGDWHLLGYCHERGAMRQFRLSRMQNARLLDDRFEMPADADAQAFWANTNPGRTGECVAHVRFAPDAVRWVRERRHYAWEHEEEGADGLVVRLRADRWDEILPWLLSWGGAMTVLEPESLRLLVAAEARRIVTNHECDDATVRALSGTSGLRCARTYRPR